MCRKERVYQFYFVEKLKVVDIAKIEGISQSAVSQILKQFPEYDAEKERRKKENQKKARRWRNEYRKQKRQLEKLQKQKKKKQEPEQEPYWYI